jgi:hypothetical protein
MLFDFILEMVKELDRIEDVWREGSTIWWRHAERDPLGGECVVW